MKGKEANAIACFDENKPAKSHTESCCLYGVHGKTTNTHCTHQVTSSAARGAEKSRSLVAAAPAAGYDERPRRFHKH